MAVLPWNERLPAMPRKAAREPRYSPDELCGVVPVDYRKPYDVREVIARLVDDRDRKSTRLNSSHGYISYAVFCLKKKKNINPNTNNNKNYRKETITASYIITKKVERTRIQQ